MLPKLLHFIWIGRPMPDWAAACINEFRRLNPGYEVRLHGEDILLPEYVPAYSRISDVCTKSDLLAISAVQRWGGWYWDTDNWPFRGVDGIVEAYQLDGDRMFVAEQHGQRNLALKIANGVLAATPDWSGWSLVREAVVTASTRIGRCDFGPVLFTCLVDEHPDLFTVGAWPWFYPAEIGRAARLFPACIRGAPRFPRRLAPTGGQLPFAMHLWCGGGDPNPGADPACIASIEAQEGPWKGKTAVLAYMKIQWDDETQPFQAIAQGLAQIGFRVRVRDVSVEGIAEDADLMLIWNGRKGHYRDRIREARELRLPVLQMEHGFFDRRSHVQIDHQGILHWASWAGELKSPAPAEGAGRLQEVWPAGLKEFGDRGGYILALGQIDNDSQMDDSEITSSVQFQKEVSRAAGHAKLLYRPHPGAARTQRSILPLAGGNLAEAVAGAQFAVTINSNSGNECLAMGCPVLCLGPALYEKAGVAMRSPVPKIKDGVESMLHGWHPATAEVRNYLEWLACRQWNAQDLRQGDVMAKLVRRAGL